MDQIALFVRGLETSLSSRDARQQLTATLTQRIEHCGFTGHATVTAMKVRVERCGEKVWAEGREETVLSLSPQPVLSVYALLFTPVCAQFAVNIHTSFLMR